MSEPIRVSTIPQNIPLHAIFIPFAQAKKLRGSPQEVRPEYSSLPEVDSAVELGPQYGTHGLQLCGLDPL